MKIFIKNKFVFLFFTVLLLASPSFAKKKAKAKPSDIKNYDLLLSQDDILLLPEDENHLVKDGSGFHLFVKKRGDIKSICLLIKNGNYNDPDLSLMRAKEFNPINGNEIRYSYGSKSTFRMERLPDSLISSTVENNFFGQCFHFYIPKEMYHGYVIQTQHECVFEEGMTVSVRAFALEYCDSSGKFNDNFLTLNSSDWQIEESFAKIADESDGKVVHVVEASELPEKLIEEVGGLSVDEPVDIVFAIDATESMKDDFVELKKNWLSKFQKQMKKFSDARIGLLLYKDYGDDFRTKGLPVKKYGFLKNAKAFSKAVKSASAQGGGDWEEAVYEALYFCAADFEWRENTIKKIILIGDAPPHMDGENTFDFEKVLSEISKNQISVDCFLISDRKEKSAKMKTVEKADAAEELLKSVDSLDAK